MANLQGPRKSTQGLQQAIISLNPENLYMKRNPRSTDRAEIGTWLFNTAASTAWFLPSITGGVSNWMQVETGGSTGSFAALTSTGATTLATTGASVNTFGNVTGATSLALLVGTGGFSVTGVAGSVFTIGTGVTTGSIGIGNALTTGSLTMGTALTTGFVTIGSGASTSALNLLAGSGLINVTGNISQTGGITSSGAIAGAAISATSDAGGFASEITLSNASVPVAGGTGVFVINPSSGAGNTANTGFIKLYLGVTAIYIPYWIATT